MIRRSDVTVSNAQGTPEGGVYITVKDDTGTLATLYNDAGALMANPFQSNAVTGAFTYNIADGDAGTFTEEFRLTLAATPKTIEAIDLSLNSVAVRYASTRTALALMTTTLPVMLTESGREGTFVWSSANLSTLVTADPNQGVYVPPVSAPTGASGAWVRTGWADLDVRWFGAVADDATDAYPAFSAAFHLIEALALPGFLNPTLYRGGPSLHVPKGKYYSSATFDPLVSFRFYGDGGKSWGAATRIRFPVGVTAFRAQAHNTSGASTVDGPHFSGPNIVVQDIYFVGAYNIAAPNEAEAHGCHAKRPIELVRCTFDGFQGDGLYSHASSGAGAPTEGNANLGRVIDCDFINNRNGRSMAGADANAWLLIGCRYDYNRAWAVDDTSFLGNTEIGAHCDSNGIIPGMPSYTMVSQGGNRYSVRVGQAAGASTNAPSGTTADNTWWLFCYAGGVSAGLIPAWFNGIAVREGGAYHTNNLNAANVFSGCYSESGQGVSQFTYPTVVLGGAMISGVKGTGGWLNNYLGSLNSGGPFRVDGVLTVKGANNEVGPAGTDAASDHVTALNTTNLSSQILFRSWAAGVSQDDGYLTASRGNGMYLNGKALITFRNNGADVAAIGPSYFYPTSDNATDLGFNNSSFRWRNLFAMIADLATSLKIAGTKVVGARATGWAVDTGTAKRTANATYAVGTTLTFSAGYVQAEATAVSTRLQLIEAALRDATQTIKALKDDIHGTAGHGLIGT